MAETGQGVMGVHLSELVPTADMLLEFEPDELGVHILSAIADDPHGEVRYFLSATQTNRTAFPPERWEQVEEAIREAWAWLEGAAFLLPKPAQGGANPYRVLSRRARQIVREKSPRRALAARSLPRDAIHPAIREEVWALYQRGRYDTAVFEAMKAVEIAVRDAANMKPTDVGVDLMRKAFNPQGGVLTDQNVPTAEREARSALFAGAMGSYKNPQSHRYVALDDPAETAEIIVLASHLLRIVDTAS